MTSAMIAAMLANDASAASLRSKQQEHRGLNQVVKSDHLVSHTEKVKYTCSFSSTWSSANQPVDYPDDAHTSPPVLVAHNANYKMFTPGAAASPGVKMVAETGSPETLMTELIDAGADVMSYIQGVPVFFGPKPEMDDGAAMDPPADGEGDAVAASGGGRKLAEGDSVKVNKGGEAIYDTRSQTIGSMLVFTPDHTMFTGISMLAPSPDWFSASHGNEAIDMNDDGEKVWLKSYKFETLPYDAGTDSGTTFKSEDSPTVPAGVITTFTADTTENPNGIFVNPAGDTVLPIYGWECTIAEVMYKCEFDEECTDGSVSSVSSDEGSGASSIAASGLMASLALAGTYLFL